MLNIAIKNPSRISKHSHTRCRICLPWQHLVSKEKTLSTIIRPFHVPRLQIFTFSGLPSLALKPVSAQIIISFSNSRRRAWNSMSETFAVSVWKPQISPNLFSTTQSLPPTIHREFDLPFLPKRTRSGKRFSLTGWHISMPNESATPKTVGSAKNSFAK